MENDKHIQERRDYKTNGNGRRKYDGHCPFYSKEQHQCVEVEGMKKVVKWGIGIIITVFLACFGYFAHNQDKRTDMLIEMNKDVISMKNLIEYRVLPKLKDIN